MASTVTADETYIKRVDSPTPASKLVHAGTAT